MSATGSLAGTRSASDARGLHITPLEGIPPVETGDDLAALLVDALERCGLAMGEGDVLVVSSKVVSKAAGLQAPAAHRAGLVLAESRAVVAERLGVGGVTRIVRARCGPVLAGAGIDASNVGADAEQVLLLPRDPDEAATALREDVSVEARRRGATVPHRWGLLLTDTAGRPWRAGLADIAIGAAGIPVVDDLRGARDADGRPLSVTVRAIADELAAAADLVKGKAEGVPAALVRGLRWPADAQGEPAPPSPDHRAAALVREGAADWFSLGTAEAVRAALGAPPGTHAAVDIGIPSAGEEDLDERVARACRLARFDGLADVPAGHPKSRLVGSRPDPASARLDILQFGVQVEAPDELTLGVVVARLLIALAGERVPAAWARTEPAAPGRGPSALVLFTGD